MIFIHQAYKIANIYAYIEGRQVIDIRFWLQESMHLVYLPYIRSRHFVLFFFFFLSFFICSLLFFLPTIFFPPLGFLACYTMNSPSIFYTSSSHLFFFFIPSFCYSSSTHFFLKFICISCGFEAVGFYNFISYYFNIHWHTHIQTNK